MDGDASSDLIAKLSDTEFEWSLAGCLEQARAGHGVVFDGASFVVAVGQYDKVTEKCTLEGDSVSCATLAPLLDAFAYYPEMFIVSENFCSKIK